MDNTKQQHTTVCPFADLQGSPQTIRRQDLVGLGDAFRCALAPISTLIVSMQNQYEQNARLLEGMQQQALRLERLQRWFVYLTAICTLGVFAQFIGVLLST